MRTSRKIIKSEIGTNNEN